MALHEKQHSDRAELCGQELSNQECQTQSQSLIQETKPRIQVKNPAELIEKPDENLMTGDQESRSMIEDKESELASPDSGKTTGKYESKDRETISIPILIYEQVSFGSDFFPRKEHDRDLSAT